MDGDLWPDLQEREAGTDDCDSDSHPDGNPPEYVRSINQDDTDHQRSIGDADDFIQMIYVDESITPNNNIYWYRIIAVDKGGNQSPLSAPIRGVLFDRSQPKPDNISLQTPWCRYDTVYQSSCDGQEACSHGDESGAFLTLVDKSNSAAYYEFFQYCSDGTTNEVYRLLLKGKTTGENTCLDYKMLNPGAESCYDITISTCSYDKVRGYAVRFYDTNKNFIAESDTFGIESFCSGGSGCIELIQDCRFKPIFYPGTVITQWPLKVCVNLEKGQMARIYHRTENGMSPVATMETAASSGEYCYELNDLDTIVPSDLCLGVRIFSANHVGSAMHYLPCVQTNAGGNPPVTPLIDDVEPVEIDLKPFFTLTWGCRTEGLSAFLISMTSGEETKYLTDWALKKDDSEKFIFNVELDTEDINKKWCFQIQALDSAMQKSEWSYEQCAVWELGTPENLPWPRVEKPGTNGKLSAFILQGGDPDSLYYKLPLIVISNALNSDDADDVSFNLNETLFCSGNDETACITDGPVNVNSYGYSQCLCNYLNQSLMFDSFIVYTQEEGRDYVQAGPLIEGFNCVSELTDKTCATSMHDPYIFLRDFASDSIGGGDEVSIPDSEGTRLVYLDRYPHPAGVRVRYKIAVVNKDSGELEDVYTTNWLEIP